MYSIYARVCATAVATSARAVAAVATSARAVAASATARPRAQACYVSIRQHTSAYVRIIDMPVAYSTPEARMCAPHLSDATR